MNLERQFFRSVQEFVESTMRSISDMSQRTSLTHTQLLIIRHINHRGLALQKDMLKHFHLTQGALSTALKDLEKQELITRTQSPVDQREWVIALSPKGEKLLKDVSTPNVLRMKELLEAYPEEVKQFVQAVDWFTSTVNKVDE